MRNFEKTKNKPELQLSSVGNSYLQNERNKIKPEIFYYFIFLMWTFIMIESWEIKS